MRSRIALAVALPGVEESFVAAEDARRLRPLLADRLGMNGSCVGADGVDLGERVVPRPRPRPRPLPRVLPDGGGAAGLSGGISVELIV